MTELHLGGTAAGKDGTSKSAYARDVRTYNLGISVDIGTQHIGTHLLREHLGDLEEQTQIVVTYSCCSFDSSGLD